MNEAIPVLAAWRAIRGTRPGPLFNPITKGGRILDRRITSQSIYNMMERRRIQAGIKPFSPHDLRRSFITDLLSANVGLEIAQQLAGHSSPETTTRYDKRPEAAKRRAVAKLHLGKGKAK